VRIDGHDFEGIPTIVPNQQSSGVGLESFPRVAVGLLTANALTAKLL
jgi:hypothetical protein